ncbi:MAG TPA: HAD family hydrolase, partial [Rhodobacterales bacterium]|nr:HAD family hydrolase [Rhodobacterales bacterium]
MMQKTGIVVFDIDGTLTDSVGPHQEAFLEAMESFDF